MQIDTFERVMNEIIHFVTQDPIAVLAPATAIVVAYLLFYEGVIYHLGDDGKIWAALRSILPLVDSTARDNGFYTTYTIRGREAVGVLSMDRDEAYDLFIEKTCIDAPLAAHKVYKPTGDKEIGSIAKYAVEGERLRNMSKLERFLTMLILTHQLHITLFAHPDGVLVTAHYEYSPYNPFLAYSHLFGIGMDIEEGVRRTQEMLEDEHEFEPSEKAITTET